MSTISSIVFLAGWRVASHISRIDAAEEAINELHEQRVVLARDTDIRWYPAIEQNSLSIHLIILFSIQYHTVDCIPTVVSYIRSPGCIPTACISLPLCWSLLLDNQRTHRCTQTHFLSFFDTGQANAYNLYNACKCQVLIPEQADMGPMQVGFQFQNDKIWRVAKVSFKMINNKYFSKQYKQE